MSGLRVERAADGHWPAVEDLFARSFRRPLAAGLLRRKYDTTHVGVEGVAHVALDGARVVAFKGLLPQSFGLGARGVLAGLACDFVTEPAYRQRGLQWSLLHDAMLAAAHARGFELVYGMAPEQALTAVRRTGWREAPVLQRHALRVPGPPLARACARLRFLRRAHQTLVRRAFAAWRLPDDAPYLNPSEGEGFLCQRYTPDLFAYKRRLAPSFRVGIGAARAWLKVDPQVMLGDFDAPDESALRGLLGALARAARRLGAGEVMALVSPGTARQERLARLLPGQPSWSLGHFFASPDLPVERLRVSLGDYDTF